MLQKIPEFSAELLKKEPNRRILFIVGPTASGKSALAIEIAKKIKGEIISADSMQVYQGMDIGTAKLLPADWQAIPHHGIDLLPPSQTFNAYDFRRFAFEKIEDIHARGNTPIVTGGSGLYVRALLEGLPEVILQNDAIREQLEERLEKEGLAALVEELKAIDPEFCSVIDTQNHVRVMRGLEIHAVTGKKPSAIREKRQKIEDLGYFPVVIGIDRDREWLYQRINERVEKMFKEGLVEEVKKIAQSGFSKTSAQAVGYKEIVEILNAKPMNPAQIDAVKTKIQQASRNFAKRQWTWFKRERNINWVYWPADAPVDVFAQYVASHIKYANPVQ